MKKIILGLISTVILSLSGFASNNGKAVAEKEQDYLLAALAKQCYSPIAVSSYLPPCWETVSASVTVTGSLSLGISGSEAKVEASVTVSATRTVECRFAAGIRNKLAYQVGEGAATTLARRLTELKNAALRRLMP